MLLVANSCTFVIYGDEVMYCKDTSAVITKNFCNSRDWLDKRKRHLYRLAQDIENGSVDSDIIPLLRVLNSDERIITSSSCSGRIVVLEALSPTHKPSARFISKWHQKPTRAEFLKVIENVLQRCLQSNQNTYIWCSVQPPILDIHVCDPVLTTKLLDTLYKNGFKNACLKILRNSYMVMVRGTTRCDIPLCITGKTIASTFNLDSIYEIISSYFDAAKKELERLHILADFIKNL